MRKLYKKGWISTMGLALALIFWFQPTQAQTQQNNNPERININTQDRSLTIYPVPVINKVHIRLSAGLKGEVSKIEIINLIGRKVTEQAIIDPNTTDIVFNNLGQFPAGVYLVLARDQYGKIVKSSKMIIAKP